MTDMGVLDLFQRGGLVMYAIALVSVVGLAVFLERMWALQRVKVLPRGLIEKVRELLAANNQRDATLLC